MLVTIGIGILPNVILRAIWSDGIAMFSFLVNSVIIPISLLQATKLINEKFDKDWWILNFSLMIGSVCLSVYLGFLNWGYWADKSPGGWGSNNVDKGTYMVMYIELYIGIGIVLFALLIKIINKIRKLKIKTNC